MFILLLFILFSTIDASSIPLLEDPKDIVINRFGSCALKDAGIIYGQYGKSIDPNIWYYSRILPTPTEEEEYAHINPSYSKVNKAFVAGIYNGTSRIEKFLRARKIWLFPPDHPRQNKSLCYSLLQAALQPSLLHQPYRESDKMKGQMYLVRASHVLVRGSGIFGSGCGYYQPIEACETGLKKIGRNWWTKCSRQLKKKGITFKDLYSQLSRNSSGVEEAKRTCIYRNATKDWQYVDKIFVMVAMWDTNFGHFLIDSLPRIVRFLPFLQANPDIKIQIRSYEQYFGNADFRLTFTQSFRNGLFRLLNISFDRVVHGPIVARQLYYPRPMKCSSPLNHPYELRLLSKILKKSALERLRHGKDLSELPTRLNVTLNGDVYLPFVGHKEGRLATEHGSIALRIILQVRYCANKTICHEAIRTWNDTDIVTIVNSFRVQFPTAQILTIKDSDSLATKCLECEIYEYSKADILIGLHGAGITNLIFMKPGSIVMEITNNFDARIMPLCGFNGPLSTVFGVHHYAYYTDLVGNVELDFNDLASEAKLFHKHVSKFSLANPLLL